MTTKLIYPWIVQRSRKSCSISSNVFKSLSWVKGVAGRGKCPFSQVQKPSRSGGMGKLVGTGGVVIASTPWSKDTQSSNRPALEQVQFSALVGTLDIHWPAHRRLQG